jgi:hypothetical protein
LVHDYAYDSVGYQVMLHYDMVYLCPSHLDRAASFGSVAVGVGGGVQQLQRRGIGGPWLLAGFGRGSFFQKMNGGEGPLRGGILDIACIRRWE